jgi:hypothetical protein
MLFDTPAYPLFLTLVVGKTRAFTLPLSLERRSAAAHAS